jgi:hypothetical protein
MASFASKCKCCGREPDEKDLCLYPAWSYQRANNIALISLLAHEERFHDWHVVSEQGAKWGVGTFKPTNV